VPMPLSVLDLVPVARGQAVGEAIAAGVALAQLAESCGYRRVWYAEHHNMPTIASSATSVLIAHIAAKTSTIRLGAGGIMLPNHAPLLIAEQFGTLASIHPGRIELGLGRAPGSDQPTMRALRRDPTAADTFPDDVLELQGYLTGRSLIPGVSAIPGSGTNVPLYILGSSLFGARLAARLGLPYTFASHFSPGALQDAVALYRREFRPSAHLERPHVLAGVTVVAADTSAQARSELQQVRIARVAALYARGGRPLTDDEALLALQSGAAQHVDQMLTYAAVGTPPEVRGYLEQFAGHADADELIVVHQAGSVESRLRSVRLTAEAMSERMPAAGG